MKKILATVISILTMLCFLVTLVLILLGIKANRSDNIVRIFGYSFSVVATDSMEPTIHPGDMISIKSVPFEEIETGDIIVYWSDNLDRYIVHRVVAKEEGRLYTKGDNPQAAIDQEFVTKENFFGIVRSYGKFFNIGRLLLNYRDVVYGLIIFLFAVIIVKETIGIVHNVKEAKEEELKEEALSKIRAEEKERLRKELLKERGEE